MLISLNIDGLRSNFDKFQIFVNTVSSYSTYYSNNITGYVLCETNVTEFESQPFYLDGYITNL